MTGKERSYLKSLANGIDPVVSIGKSGLTDSVLQAIHTALTARELVKVSIQEGVDLDPKETCHDVANELHAEFVQAIGRRFVLYRPAPDKSKRKIVLPK
ncbi:MAG: YhbY family RNA-binding protein [Eubacterium sp.]|nr:YhbY family RNA-binding protein [Eubacterium sp.]